MHASACRFMPRVRGCTCFRDVPSLRPARTRPAGQAVRSVTRNAAKEKDGCTKDAHPGDGEQQRAQHRPGGQSVPALAERPSPAGAEAGEQAESARREHRQGPGHPGGAAPHLLPAGGRVRSVVTAPYGDPGSRRVHRAGVERPEGIDRAGTVDVPIGPERARTTDRPAAVTAAAAGRVPLPALLDGVRPGVPVYPAARATPRADSTQTVAPSATRARPTARPATLGGGIRRSRRRAAPRPRRGRPDHRSRPVRHGPPHRREPGARPPGPPGHDVRRSR